MTELLIPQSPPSDDEPDLEDGEQQLTPEHINGAQPPEETPEMIGLKSLVFASVEGRAAFEDVQRELRQHDGESVATKEEMARAAIRGAIAKARKRPEHPLQGKIDVEVATDHLLRLLKKQDQERNNEAH